MITPGLWTRALRGGAQWRLLLLWTLGLAVPALVALLPLAQLLGTALDHAPRARALAGALDAEAFVDLIHVLFTPEAHAATFPAVKAMAVLALLVQPLLAGAAATAACTAEPLHSRALLQGVGAFYARMARVLVVAALPLGIAAALSALAFGGAHRRALKAATESSADAGTRAAACLALVLVFLAHVTIDLARGTLAAHPGRRSAFFAWGHAVRLLARRPLQTLGLALATSVPALLLAALLLLARLQITQRSVSGVLAALVLAQLAVAAVGWSRMSRVIGFCELVWADDAERHRLAATVSPAAAATLPAIAAAETPPAEVATDKSASGVP